MQRWTVDVPERSLAKGHLYCKTGKKLHLNRHSLNFNQNNSPLVSCLTLKINDVEWIREVPLRKKRQEKLGLVIGQSPCLSHLVQASQKSWLPLQSLQLLQLSEFVRPLSVSARSATRLLASLLEPFASDCLFMTSRTSVLPAWISGCKR